MQTGVFKFLAQERVMFGTPAGEAVAAEADRLGAVRVFLTSTRSLAALDDGPLQQVQHALGARHAGTFFEIGSHSPRGDVVAGANAARAAGADLMVAVGGGSVIDATKAMLLCLWMGIDRPEQLDAYRSGFDRLASVALDLPSDPIRMIAVSTTLSASEFTQRAGITDTATGTKEAFNHRLMAPQCVILDPDATRYTPEWLLFGTGMRAVDHAVESYCSPAANLATETLSLKGLALLGRSLRRIKETGGDMAARQEAQIGMWHAIWPSASGAYHGASHGIGYALGAGFGVPHGHTSCVILPAVMRWNSAVNGERQQALAAALGEPGRPAWQLVGELVGAIGMPRTLRDVGIEAGQLDELAERALDYQPVRLNPRPITSAAQVREILDLAW